MTDNPQLSRIFENLNTAVLAFDHDLRLVAINPAGEILLGAGRRHILRKGIDEILRHGRVLESILQKALKSLQPFTARSVRLALTNHRTINVDCTVTPLLEGRQASGLLVELSQVDRLMRLARDESSHERLSASHALLKGLAHEIKNPLGGLRGAAQLLEKELHSEALKEYTHIIIHEADRLRSLVDRMMGPDRPPEFGEVNIHEILHYVRKLLLSENPEGLSLRFDYDPSLPALSGDREQLIQAVLNITRNAVQAAGKDGHITLRTRIARQFTIGQRLHRLALKVDIEDDGPGISQDMLEQIFFPLVTGRAEGTGLGLAIAQDLVSRHGGHIDVCSKPGQTIFSIYLPLENSHA